MVDYVGPVNPGSTFNTKNPTDYVHIEVIKQDIRVITFTVDGRNHQVTPKDAQ